MQNITFCGVGAHHQNDIYERIIKDLTLSSRTLVLHAQSHWPEYITTIFWPFALVAAADRTNYIHVDMHGQTPEMKFSNTIGSSTRLSHFHTFGCPVYIMDADYKVLVVEVPLNGTLEIVLGYILVIPHHTQEVLL